MPQARPIVILGPTAGGKSELAVAVAERLGGQIISADSMQVYRHMDAGTAKPSAVLRRRVKHHLIDIVEPTERFTVADWVGRASALIGQLATPGIRPIVVGGTNLYIKALLEGLFVGPPIDRAMRGHLDVADTGSLHRQLAAIDPKAASRIDRRDRRRLLRALEVFHSTGRPISQWQTQWGRSFGTSIDPEAGAATAASPIGPEAILIGLQWPVVAINRRINRRVKAMFLPEKVDPDAPGPRPESLPCEVRRLHADRLLGSQASQALGYKQVLEHLEGRCSLAEAFERTKILTRRFAKQQRTWLRRFGDVYWVQPGALTSGAAAQHVVNHVASQEVRHTSLPSRTGGRLHRTGTAGGQRRGPRADTDSAG